jgi:hypothetical protein
MPGSAWQVRNSIGPLNQCPDGQRSREPPSTHGTARTLPAGARLAPATGPEQAPFTQLTIQAGKRRSTRPRDGYISAPDPCPLYAAERGVDTKHRRCVKPTVSEGQCDRAGKARCKQDGTCSTLNSCGCERQVCRQEVPGDVRRAGIGTSRIRPASRPRPAAATIPASGTPMIAHHAPAADAAAARTRHCNPNPATATTDPQARPPWGSSSRSAGSTAKVPGPPTPEGSSHPSGTLTGTGTAGMVPAESSFDSSLYENVPDGRGATGLPRVGRRHCGDSPGMSTVTARSSATPAPRRRAGEATR